MLCSLAELGWDLSVTDRVALLDDSLGLQLVIRWTAVTLRWALIVRPAGSFVSVSGISPFRTTKCVNRLNCSTFRAPSSRTQAVSG